MILYIQIKSPLNKESSGANRMLYEQVATYEEDIASCFCKFVMTTVKSL